jgi:hypothetical protein
VVVFSNPGGTSQADTVLSNLLRPAPPGAVIANERLNALGPQARVVTETGGSTGLGVIAYWLHDGEVYTLEVYRYGGTEKQASELRQRVTVVATALGRSL